MKAQWVFSFAMVAGFSVRAEGCEIIVYLSSGPVPYGMVTRAEGIATDMFREIGVQVRWRRGRARTPAEDDACVAPLRVNLNPDATHDQASPDAYGYAIPLADSG